MKTIPFYSNSSDNTHCLQAALKMILKYFEPDKDFSFDELDEMTAKVKNLWTWPTAGILNLRRMGYDVVILDAFDYERFSQSGEEYLIEYFGKDIAAVQIKNSYIPQETSFIKELLKTGITLIKIPSLENIKSLLDKGYLVICNIDAGKLNNVNEYIGHFVVVYKITDSNVVFHDPGLPPQESRSVNIKDFEDAWSVTHDAYAFKLNKL